MKGSRAAARAEVWALGSVLGTAIASLAWGAGCERQTRVPAEREPPAAVATSTAALEGAPRAVPTPARDAGGAPATPTEERTTAVAAVETADPADERVAAVAAAETAEPAAERVAAKPKPRRSFGRRSPSCINGWFTPPRGSRLRTAALDMMRSKPRQRFVIDEMRYFVGPEDADVVQRKGRVERWYVKAYVAGKPARRQRWLIRRSRAGSGVDATAPYDSVGYGPGVWTRIDAPHESLADPFQHPCEPEQPAKKCMGLPPEVLGCLEGT